ncbi:transcription initiation factor IIB [Coprinopsis marcescibilis]|uniref:General transcription factor TFIIB n=1 Tax=Coprinopsis marcescibilis TaxID=230819 RepID=A0A5C3KYZ2_COPMA|nr:transcription initiation factor IIB [Coprinopsis marcescibilis]
MDEDQIFSLADSLREEEEAKGPRKAYGPDLAVRLICPECLKAVPNIMEEFSSGDLVCGDCGLVLGDRIVDTRSEWRTFANDSDGGDDPSRVGEASEGTAQLETFISFKDGKTGLSNQLQLAARSQTTRSKRSIETANRKIDNWCQVLDLPKAIVDTAKVVYQSADKGKLLRTKPLEPVVVACIFIACRQGNATRSFKDICRVTRVQKKLLAKCYKVLEKALTNGDQRGSRPEDLLGMYCNHLNMPPYVQGYCKDVIELARERGLGTSRSPLTVVGATIYFVGMLFGQPRTLAEIREVAGASEPTIRGVYKLYYAQREALVKKQWIEDGKADLSRLAKA